MKEILAISLGEGRDVTANNPHNGREYTARLEFLPFGEFTSKGDYYITDLKREPDPKLSIGVTADYNGKAARSRGNLGSYLSDSTDSYLASDLVTYFIDGVFKYKGLSLHSEYAFRNAETQVAGFGYGRGFVGCVGYLLPSNFEIAGRYTLVSPISTVSSIDEWEEYTLAFSQYIRGHNLKIQSDVAYYIRNSTEHFRVRLQFEVAL